MIKEIDLTQIIKAVLKEINPVQNKDAFINLKYINDIHCIIEETKTIMISNKNYIKI